MDTETVKTWACKSIWLPSEKMNYVTDLPEYPGQMKYNKRMYVQIFG